MEPCKMVCGQARKSKACMPRRTLFSRRVPLCVPMDPRGKTGLPTSCFLRHTDNSRARTVVLSCTALSHENRAGWLCRLWQCGPGLVFQGIVVEKGDKHQKTMGNTLSAVPRKSNDTWHGCNLRCCRPAYEAPVSKIGCNPHTPKLRVTITSYFTMLRHTTLSWRMTLSGSRHISHSKQYGRLVLPISDTHVGICSDVHWDLQRQWNGGTQHEIQCPDRLLWELHKLLGHVCSEVPFSLPSSGFQSLPCTSWRQPKHHERYIPFWAYWEVSSNVLLGDNLTPAGRKWLPQSCCPLGTMPSGGTSFLCTKRSWGGRQNTNIRMKIDIPKSRG